MANTKIRIAAVGSKSDGINEINPRFQAEALRNIRGIDCGVLDNSFYSSDGDPYGVKKDTNANFMFKLTVEEDKVTITVGRGMATAYGYDFQTEEDISITSDDSGHSLTSTSGATQYCFVYLEWDLSTSPNAGDIKVHNNGTASIWRSLLNSNANLIENPTGVYKLPIYRFAVTSTGIDSGTVVSWEDMNLCPTITRPQVAEVARFAEDVDKGDISTAIANTAFVQNASDANLAEMRDALEAFYENFSSTTLTVLGVECDIAKQNGVVCITSENYLTNPAGWTWGTLGTSFSQISVGDVVGEIPSTAKDYYGNTVSNVSFVPTEDVYITFFVLYKWANTSTSSYDGEIRVRLRFATNGVIYLDYIQNQPTGVSNVAYFLFTQYSVHWGWRASSSRTWLNNIFAKYPVATNIADDAFCEGIPDYIAGGQTYTIRAYAREPSSECYVVVRESQTDGSLTSSRLTAYGNGEFTFDTHESSGVGRPEDFSDHPQRLRMSGLYNQLTITITTRYYENGTPDE